MDSLNHIHTPMNYVDVASVYVSDLIALDPFDGFLNTTQTGSAHQSSGTELQELLKHFTASVCICIIEITFFCYLRVVYRSIYLPICDQKPKRGERDECSDDFFGWIIPTLRYDIQSYLSEGLDAYFFLRFITLLLIFFSTCGLLNLIILLPVNYFGDSSGHLAVGMDKFSISNISQNNAVRINIHLVCGIVTILSFCLLVYLEMENIISIRQKFMSSDAHRLQLHSTVVLIGNVPKVMRNKLILKSNFQNLPGGIKEIWFVDDFEVYWWKWREAKFALDLLEKYLVSTLKRYARKERLIRIRDSKDTLFFPPVFLPPVHIPVIQRFISVRLPGIVRVCGFLKRTHLKEWVKATLRDNYSFIHNRRIDIVEGSVIKKSRVFLQFKTQEAANMACQLLLSQEAGCINRCVSEVNPTDILWWNLVQNDSFFTEFQRYFVCLMFIVLCMIYVVPVSFITLLSHLPTISRLLPFLSWLDDLPPNVRIVISNILPSLLLSTFSGLVNRLMRKLTYLKGMWTGSEMEMDLQNWYFLFLFIQHFLVVSVLSSLLSVIVQVVDKPVSIPILLAGNIPKSATFFFKYLPVKTFAICGSHFLRVEELFMEVCFYLWWNVTPRAKAERRRNIPKINWGSVYPCISLYGTIGITYCVISPMISIFMIVIFVVLLVCYRYSLRYVYGHFNPSETYGRVYSKALFQLYTGIYCLEFCLMGVCLSRKDEDGTCPLKAQGFGMVLVFIATLLGNIYMHNRFKKHIRFLPLTVFGSQAESPENEDSSNSAKQYYHPCYKYKLPYVWIPKDDIGNSDKMLVEFLGKDWINSAISGTMTEGAKLQLRKHHVVTRVDFPTVMNNPKYNL